MPPCFARLFAPRLLCVVIFSAAAVEAADVVRGKPGNAQQKSVIDFSELARLEAAGILPPAQPKVVHPPRRKRPSPRPRPESTQPAVQSRSLPIATPRSPPPALSFQALDDDDTAIPPDTHGAVGPGHLMVVHNTQVRIQDRIGNAISTVSLNNFWAALNDPDIPDVFDPRVMFDPYGKRFIFTAVANAERDSASIMIGVSQTDDPTGQWNLFRVDADPDDFLFADFPSLGFNKDWIVVSANMFDGFFGGFFQVNIYAFDKAALYAGTSANHTLMIDDSAFGFTICPAATYDETASTLYLMEDYDSFSGQLRINTITGAVGSEVLTLNAAFPTSSQLWLNFGDLAPQLGSDKLIDSGDSRMMNVVYRNGSLWCAHGIFLPFDIGATHSAVQWWQVSPTGQIIQRGLIEDPTGATYYSYPTIAVNKDNDALIGYSRFSAAQYASANYAFRRASDPPGTCRGDVVLKAGEAPYAKQKSGTVVRWGDYSATVVDPLNDTDMWTIQEYAALPVAGIDRWATWWGKIVPADTGEFVTVSSPDDFASESGGNTAYFLVQRSGSIGTLNVNYNLSGNAANGTDYEPLNGIVTLPDGAQSAKVLIRPIDNTTLDGTRSVFLTLAPGDGYGVGNPYGAGASIVDNEQLKITTGPTATPNPAITGISVEFTVAADSPDITGVLWDFDDFTEDTSNRLTLTHAFAEEGVYSVVVFVTHKSGSSAIGSVDVVVSNDTDRDGNPDNTDPDDDNDGFPDNLEIELDTDPLDVNDTPLGGSPAGPAQPLAIKRLAAKLNFRSFFEDTLSINGSLEIPAATAAPSTVAVVDFGGAATPFDLDERGRGFFGFSSVKFNVRRTNSTVPAQTVKFTVKIRESDFLEALEDEGITDEADVKNEKHTIIVSLFFNNTIYQATVPVLYSAKPFVVGTIKQDLKANP